MQFARLAAHGPFVFYDAWAVPRELRDWFVPILQEVVKQDGVLQ